MSGNPTEVSHSPISLCLCPPHYYRRRRLRRKMTPRGERWKRNQSGRWTPSWAFEPISSSRSIGKQGRPRWKGSPPSLPSLHLLHYLRSRSSTIARSLSSPSGQFGPTGVSDRARTGSDGKGTNGMEKPREGVRRSWSLVGVVGRGWIEWSEGNLMGWSTCPSTHPTASSTDRFSPYSPSTSRVKPSED